MIFGFGRMTRGRYFVQERPKTGSRAWVGLEIILIIR
jgi:hypothetical protein